MQILNNKNAVRGRVDKVFETVDKGSTPRGVKSKTIKIVIPFSCLTLVLRHSVKPPPCVTDKWIVGSLTQRHRVTSLFPGQGNLVNEAVNNTVIATT